MMDGITNYKLLKRIFLVKICLEDGMFFMDNHFTEFLAIGFQVQTNISFGNCS